jgi:hypothetical protein
MTLSTDALWFEAAVMATVIAMGHIYLGHFEERTPKWRKMAKRLGSIGAAMRISGTLGRYSSLRSMNRRSAVDFSR